MFSSSLYKKTQSGFTLIEVMVAVAVIAVALPALTMSMITQIDGTAYLRDKMQAQWVAENQLAEIRIKNRTTGQVPKSKQTGSEELADRNWRWEITSEATKGDQFKDIYRLQVSVWRETDSKDDPSIVTMQGLLQKFENKKIDRPPAKNYNGSGGKGS
ncbi:MAG: type II secretion system minor pseudopilin GspI [Pseudomonadales bacterium]|nr:type II secretion system minor pseudopilin GspI [Pseudomonadales bacterium]